MSTATLSRSAQSTFTEDFLHELRVKSQDHLKIFLGRYDDPETPRGFVIEVRPSTVPQNLVSARITRLDDASNTKFFLDIVNRSGRSIRARIRHI